MAIELEVKLKDGVSAPAGSAAHQVDVLTRQLRSLQSQMIKANALNDDKSFNRAAASYRKISDQIQALGGQQSKTTETMKKATSAAKDSSGALSDLVQSLTGVSASTMSAAGAATMAVAAYGALVVGFAKVTQHAYEAAAAHGVLLARLNAMGGGAVKGEEVVEMMRRMGRVLPQTQKEMEPFVETMMRAGVRDLPRLEQGLKASAAAAALVGDSGGKTMSDFVGSLNDAARMRAGMGDLTGKLGAMGLTVEETAKAAGIASKDYRVMKIQLDAIAKTPAGLQKLGAVVQDLAIRKGRDSLKAMGATWESVTKKISEGATRLFTDVQKTEGFKSFAIELQRLAQLLGLIDDSSKGTKAGVASMFDAIFKIGTKAIEGIHLLILDLQIAYLEWRIALFPIQKLYEDFSKSIEERTPTWVTFTNVAKGLSLVFAGIAVSMGLMIAPLLAITTALVAAFTTALAALGLLADKFYEVGKAIIGGLARGIKSGYDLVTSYVGGLSKKVTDTATNKLEIKSPSKVFARIGMNVTRGFGQGIDQGTPEVAGATAKMAMSAAGGGSVGVATGAPAAGKSGVTVNLAPGSIQISGAGSAHEALALVEESIVSLFERVALTQGVA